MEMTLVSKMDLVGRQSSNKQAVKLLGASSSFHLFLFLAAFLLAPLPLTANPYKDNGWSSSVTSMGLLPLQMLHIHSSHHSLLLRHNLAEAAVLIGLEL